MLHPRAFCRDVHRERGVISSKILDLRVNPNLHIVDRGGLQKRMCLWVHMCVAAHGARAVQYLPDLRHHFAWWNNPERLRGFFSKRIVPWLARHHAVLLGTCCTGGRGRSTAPTSSAAGRAGMLGSPSLRLAPCTLASHRRFPRPTHLSLTNSTPKASPSSPSLYAFPARGSLTPPLHPPPPSVVSHPLRGLMHPRVRA